MPEPAGLMCLTARRMIWTGNETKMQNNKLMVAMNKQNSVMLLATRFQELGDWTVEQQFVLQMGYSYLLAHGI